MLVDTVPPFWTVGVAETIVSRHSKVKAFGALRGIVLGFPPRAPQVSAASARPAGSRTATKSSASGSRRIPIERPRLVRSFIAGSSSRPGLLGQDAQARADALCHRRLPR